MGSTSDGFTPSGYNTFTLEIVRVKVGLVLSTHISCGAHTSGRANQNASQKSQLSSTMDTLPKMEVLKRPEGAPQGPLRVVSNASMTMKFSLPASFLQTRAALATASAIQESKNVENAVENTETSWEERDWEAEAPQAVDTDSAKQEEDDWEEEATPDLPDDFPRLIVNLSRVQRQHFPDSKEEDPDMMEVFHRIKATLHQHFSQLAEVLFEQKSCFHCTYGTSRSMMEGLHEAYPDDFFAMVDYPTEIDGVQLHEFLHTLSFPSKWKSVEYLKDCLRRCSRDIRWKKDVITELELLAEQEFAQYEEKQQQLSAEIDELTRLRDSFREKLEKLESHEGKPKGQYLMLRKLEDIENRLVALLDEYLKEPELEEEECYSAFGNPGGESGVSTGMNVLDMVIAMVFGRLPRDFSQKTTTEEHFQMLFDHHIHILRLWKKDFGRLPPKSRVAPPKANGSEPGDAIELEGEEKAVPDVSDEGNMEKHVDASLSYYPAGDDNEAGGSDEAAYIGLDDDWETVYVEDSDNDRLRGNTRHDNDSDGYGADFDSDESDDEEEQAAALQIQLEQKKLEEAKANDAGKASSPTRPRRRRVKHTRRSKTLQKAKMERDDSDREELAPFQPFACTGAVGMLRLAKEREMF